MRTLCAAPRVVALLAFLACLPVPALAAAPAAAATVPDELRTVAERTDFRSTSSLAETRGWLERLAPLLPEMHLGSFGMSAAGRELPLVVVAKDRAFTPALARATGRPIVLLQSGIHAGEIDGKDATLLLLRDLALGDRTLLDHVILLIVPVYNVDGHERVSPFNRATQDGPVDGMGWRPTAQGFDLNRDHVKLETPEARALLRLWNEWQPHLHVDNHVTNGIDHGWRLTWSIAEPPLLPLPVHQWVAPRLRAALAATDRAGHATGPYVDLVDPRDPAAGISSMVDTARFSTVYFPLRNRASVLVETNAHQPFAARVGANHAFLHALLREVAADPAGLVAATERADREATTRTGDTAVAWKVAAPDRIDMPLPEWRTERSAVSGADTLRTAPPLRPVEVPWHHTLEPARTVPRPRGYLIERGWPEIEQRLRDHGLVVRQLREPAELEVETLRVTAPRFAATPFQGRIRVEATARRERERRTFAAGTLWIPSQPAFDVALQLLEPEAPDSLFAWGYLNQVFERKEWAPLRVLDRFAAERLANDATLRADWEKTLTDPAFAASAEARTRWWYERSPWFDRTVGMLPYWRVVTDASFATSPWE